MTREAEKMYANQERYENDSEYRIKTDIELDTATKLHYKLKMQDYDNLKPIRPLLLYTKGACFFNRHDWTEWWNHELRVKLVRHCCRCHMREEK